MSIDLHTLAGAYALDALSPAEADAFATHLEECPACRDEVRELQEAAARMGASEATAPPRALKARVLAAADQQPQLPPKVTPIDAAPARAAGCPASPGPLPPWCSLAGAVFGVSQFLDRDEPPVAAEPGLPGVHRT